MKKLRILYIQETDWLDKGPQQQHHLFERLSNQGHTVVVIDYEILWRDRTNLGFLSKKIVMKSPSKACDESNIFLIRPKAIRSPLLNYFSIIFTYGIEIYKIINQFTPDVVIGGGLLTVTLGQLLATRKKIPFIYLTVDKLYTLLPLKIFQPLGLALESYLAKRADYNVLINEQLREFKIRIDADPEKTTVIRAGVELELFNPNPLVRKRMRQKLGYSDSDRVLFFMGWLYRFSGLKEIVEELAKKRDKNVKLCIVGTGDLLETLLNLRKTLKLNNHVQIINWVNYRKLPAYLSVADICLLPAYQNKTMDEIVPIKLYEYLAMEKPVITTKLKGIMREFGKNNGVIYCSNPREVFEKAISLTDERIKELGNKGRQFVEENCNWEDLTDRFRKIMEELTLKTSNSKMLS
ncbi:MAG: glycosyltransferase [Promethearchaeota archaeon]